MKRRFFAICSILIAAILLGAAVPGCAPAGEGTIEVKAIDLCGPEAWEGLVTYTLSCEGQADVTGSSVPGSHTVAAGTWNITFDAGGPPNAYVDSITPSASQTVADGGTKTFTFNFNRGLDAEISFATWTINGVPAEGSWAPLGPFHNITMGDVIGMEFQQRVRGCPGQDVTVNETVNLLVYHMSDWQTFPLQGRLHVADQDCAVNKTPTYQQEARTEKLLQQVTVYGSGTAWAYPLPGCTSFNFSDDWLTYGYPPVLTYNYTFDTPSVILDENSMWGLETGPLYDKSINFLTFGFHDWVPEDCVLFQTAVDQSWTSIFVLLGIGNVELVDAEDINPGNNWWITYDPPLCLVLIHP